MRSSARSPAAVRHPARPWASLRKVIRRRAPLSDVFCRAPPCGAVRHHVWPRAAVWLSVSQRVLLRTHGGLRAIPGSDPPEDFVYARRRAVQGFLPRKGADHPRPKARDWAIQFHRSGKTLKTVYGSTEEQLSPAAAAEELRLRSQAL